MDISLRKEAGSVYIAFGGFRLAYIMLVIFIICDIAVHSLIPTLSRPWRQITSLLYHYII